MYQQSNIWMLYMLPYQQSLEEYKSTAGFPWSHISIFQKYAQEQGCAIICRGLNYLCSDLLLENYSAKGFHIKAKTCDFGPMGGFVPLDYRYVKITQSVEKQKDEIHKYLDSHSNKLCYTKLKLSISRVLSLVDNGLISILCDRSAIGKHPIIACTFNNGATKYFSELRLLDDCHTYGVEYTHNDCIPTDIAVKIKKRSTNFNCKSFYVLTNPGSSPDHYLNAVCGDYDLWGIFPHNNYNKILSINDRMMHLKEHSHMASRSRLSPSIIIKMQQLGTMYPTVKSMVDEASIKEDKHLGNISLGVLTIIRQLNKRLRPEKSVVMHSDYGGNPFATLDYPLISFIPQFSEPKFFSKVLLINNQYELSDHIFYLKHCNFNTISLNPNYGGTIVKNLFSRGKIL